MKTTEFENQENEDRELTKEEFEFLMDMMSQEKDYDQSDIEYSLDGFGVLKDGSVVFTDKDTINYEKALRNQKKKPRLTLIK